MESTPCLQVIVLEVNVASWDHLFSESNDLISMEELAKILCLFLNSFALLHRQNRLCVIAHHNGQACVVFPRRDISNYDSFIPSSETSEILLHYFCEIIKELSHPTVTSTGLSGALSKALCGKKYLYCFSIFQHSVFHSD